MIMDKLKEKSEIYASEKMNELMAKAIAQAYVDGYCNGYQDRDNENKESNFVDDEIEVYDLGLPSGTLWSPNYLKNEDEINYLPYVEAVKLGLPSKEQVDELVENCRWHGSFSSSRQTLYEAFCIGASGESISLTTAGYEMEDERVDAGYGNASAYFWIQDDDDGDEKYAVKIYNVRDGKPCMEIVKIFSGYKLPVLIVRK